MVTVFAYLHRWTVQLGISLSSRLDQFLIKQTSIRLPIKRLLMTFYSPGLDYSVLVEKTKLALADFQKVIKISPSVADPYSLGFRSHPK